MWILLLALLPGAEAVFCKQCFNYNGQVCVNAQDCNGNYCLFEEIVQYSGVRSTRKTCISQPYFQYPDGTYLTNVNECTTRNTNGAEYIVKICSDQNYCNDVCNSYVLPTPPPYTPPPTTFPPIVPGHVRCFNCETFDGTDCRDGACTGRYCLYERQLTGNQMRVKKSCLQDATFVLDDGTAVQSVDVCEIRNTHQSQYYIKMCNDQDYCNGYCNPEVPVTNSPQRQPLVTCSCDGPDCPVNGQCQANYCFYQREMQNGLQVASRRGCSSAPFLLYPDNTYTTQINQCEYKRINDIDYQSKVCNNGNFCNTDCFSAPLGKTVTCTQCEATNAVDCTGSTCTGSYCLYEYQKSQTNGQSMVKKSCTISKDVVYPDQTLYNSFGACESKSVNGVTYTLKLCNSTNYCNFACSSDPATTYLPVQSAAVWGCLPTLLFVFLLLN